MKRKTRSILVLVVSCIFITSCRDKGQEEKLNKLTSEFKILSQNLAEKEFDFSEIKQKLVLSEEKAKKLQDETNQLKTELQQLNKDNESLRDKSKSIQKDFDDYKIKYKATAKNKFKGLQIDKIQTKNGSVYEDVIVKSIEDDCINIMHASGSSRLPASELGRELADKLAVNVSIAKVKSASIITKTAINEKSPIGWKPKNIDDLVDCSLMVWVTTLTDTGSVAECAGSAFLCNIHGATYIYTNAHNFDRAIKVEFKHADGKSVNDFSEMEIATAPFGYFKEFGQGGDVIRIRLANYREKALTLAGDDLTQEKLKDCDIYVTGNTKGRGEITKLSGKITEIKERNILMHNAPTQAGNSGSPIVRAKDLKVIGILTWGAYDDENPFLSLWKKQPDDVRQGINSGPLIYDFEFEETSMERIQKQRQMVNETRKLARILGLLDAIVPAHTGIFTNPNQTVVADFTVKDILNESKHSNAIKRLVGLDRQLKAKADSKIPYANKQILKFYHKAMVGCIQDIIRDRQSVELEVRSLHYFYRGAVEKSNVINVCKAYEMEMNNIVAWYERQASVSGDPLPLNARVRLPSIQGGFDKYIKNE